MKLVFLVLISFFVLIFIFFLIKFLTRNKGEDNSESEGIVNRARSVGSRFKECCAKGFKKMFGGGA